MTAKASCSAPILKRSCVHSQPHLHLITQGSKELPNKGFKLMAGSWWFGFPPRPGSNILKLNYDTEAPWNSYLQEPVWCQGPNSAFWLTRKTTTYINATHFRKSCKYGLHFKNLPQSECLSDSKAKCLIQAETNGVLRSRRISRFIRNELLT